MWSWWREMKFVPLEQAVEICDTLRKPVNAKERQKRVEGKSISELYPYYGATGQVGYIDGFISDGEYVLLGEDGAPFLQPTATKAYVIRGKAWVNNHAHVLRSKFNNAFLCHYLNSFNYQGLVSGTTRLKLTQSAMKQIPVPAPPISEQQRIVSRIEELFSQLDASVAELKTAKKRLGVYRQAVLKEAFESYGTWEKCRFVDLMDTVKNGYGLKPTDKGDHRILKISAVRPMKLDVYECRYNNNPFDQDYLIEENDLLFTRYNGSREFVGVCAYVPKLPYPYGYPDKLIKCTPKLKSTVHSKYLQYYMSQGDARKYIRSKIKTTSGQNGISGSDIKNTIVYLPNMCEQEKIVIKIESRLSVCDSIEKTVDIALQQAEALRQSILKKAFEERS